MQFKILLDILFELLQKQKLTASYIARKHELSPRTVYRYVEKLSECVPLQVKRGRDGGIFLSECYKLPLNFMTETEYVSVRAASATKSVNRSRSDGRIYSKSIFSSL